MTTPTPVAPFGALPPEPPDLPATHRASARIPLRYEDVTQDGRLAMEALAPALGEVVWRKLLLPLPTTPAFRAQGIVPILSRLVLQGTGGPFATHHPIEASGLYEFAHAGPPDGDVERIVLNMWTEASLPIGRNFGPRPPNAGELTVAGRLFAEHVLTRLFAPPEARKVTRLDIEGVPEVPGRRLDVIRAASLLALPPGAVPLEPEATRDPGTIVFALAHTDSNQHVNSLVYPRLFEDAAIRRFARMGRLATPVLARFCEAAFRKPCFAGEHFAIVLRAFEIGGRLGAVGAYVPEADAARSLAELRPHCTVRMLFEA